jgi:hypothetical protein
LQCHIEKTPAAGDVAGIDWVFVQYGDFGAVGEYRGVFIVRRAKQPPRRTKICLVTRKVHQYI